MRSGRFQDAFDKLAAAERDFLGAVFLAPAVDGGEVQVRIAGVVTRLRFTPADFRGFGVFKPVSHRAAELVAPATLAQRRQYLSLFPLVRLVLCRRRGDDWLAGTAHRGDQRFRIDGLVPVRMVEDAQQFEVIRTRFDGGNFWFESIDSGRDPATAAWLRKQLHDNVQPQDLARAGLTPEERSAYAVNIAPPPPQPEQPPAPADQSADRLQQALAHAGAELVDYLERDDSYRVTYTVDGQHHVSAIRKDDLTVQVAGICLSGEDQQFDLTSLVGVLREAGEAD